MLAISIKAQRFFRAFASWDELRRLPASRGTFFALGYAIGGRKRRLASPCPFLGVRGLGRSSPARRSISTGSTNSPPTGAIERGNPVRANARLLFGAPGQPEHKRGRELRVRRSSSCVGKPYVPQAGSDDFEARRALSCARSRHLRDPSRRMLPGRLVPQTPIFGAEFRIEIRVGVGRSRRNTAACSSLVDRREGETLWRSPLRELWRSTAISMLRTRQRRIRPQWRPNHRAAQTLVGAGDLRPACGGDVVGAEKVHRPSTTRGCPDRAGTDRRARNPAVSSFARRRRSERSGFEARPDDIWKTLASPA